MAGECVQELQVFETELRKAHRQIGRAMKPDQKAWLSGRSWAGARFFDYQDADGDGGTARDHERAKLAG